MPSENQTLLLWRLVAASSASGSVMQKDLKPDVVVGDRKELVRLGLLRVETEKRGAVRLTVTDEGWRWADSNLGAKLPPRASAGIALLLQSWLTLLHTLLRRHEMSLSDLFKMSGNEGGSISPVLEAKAPFSKTSVKGQVRAAYLALTGGEIKSRCLLRDLRARLSNLSRSDVDTTVGQMVRSGEAVLFRLDNRLEITAADTQAAICTGGEQQHILWLDR
jgi:hypothetical protein